jgi:hypothetical protein
MTSKGRTVENLIETRHTRACVLSMTHILAALKAEDPATAKFHFDLAYAAGIGAEAAADTEAERIVAKHLREAVQEAREA